MKLVQQAGRLNARGEIKIVLLVLALVLVVGAGFAYWFLKVRPSPQVNGPRPSPTPVSFKGDPALATDQLLKALNEKLKSMDLLKLLDADVETRPATVQGKIFTAYGETFRLPLRYSAEEIAVQLEKAAKPLGAKLIPERLAAIGNNGNKTVCFSFVYNSEWTPVRITFFEINTARVCLIIDDAGYRKGETLQILYSLKVPVTVAIIPHAEFSTSLAEEFPERGVEVMCHMPMEGHEKGGVGENYQALLRKGMSSSAAKEDVKKALDNLPNCRGLNNHMGSVATEDPELMWDVCQVLKRRGLFIIDSRTTAQSTVEPVAKKAQVPVANRDVFLDNVEEPEAIQKQLELLVSRANRKRLAVGIGHFKTTTLKTLAEAIPALKEQGIRFVYASEIVK